MYYYIMDPPKGNLAKTQEKIKDILGDLGIAGETVTPSAARTAEELTKLGIMKGYSTIVAVGSEGLANRIISVLVTEKTAKDVVLGILPDGNENALTKITNASDIRGACMVLKQRKLKVVDLCQIEPNKFFMTEAIVESFRTRNINIAVDTLQGEMEANQIIIRPGLDVFIHDKALEGNSIKRLGNWLFSKKESDIYSSYFSTKSLKLETTHVSLSVKVAGETIAKTPIVVWNRPKCLKIIVARDRIKEAQT